MTAGLVVLTVLGSSALATIRRADAPVVTPDPLPSVVAVERPSSKVGEQGPQALAAPAVGMASRPVAVQVVAPEAQGEALLGVILARASVDIAAPAEGRIHVMDARIGDRVAAGARIAQIDLPDARFELEMAEAAAKAAQIEHERAQVELAEAEARQARRQALSADALTSKEDLDASRYQTRLAKVRMDAAAAVVRQQRARVEQLRQENAEAEIRAPFEGIVAVRYADAGARVGKGQPIVKLIAASERFVRFAVPEERAAEVTVGQPMRVAAGQLELTGRVERVAPEIDAASRMVVVEAGLDQGARGLDPMRSGEMARVWLSGPQRN